MRSVNVARVHRNKLRNRAYTYSRDDKLYRPTQTCRCVLTGISKTACHPGTFQDHHDGGLSGALAYIRLRREGVHLK